MRSSVPASGRHGARGAATRRPRPLPASRSCLRPRRCSPTSPARRRPAGTPTAGPCAQELSERLGAWLGGGTFVVPVANCTVGLMAALRAACGEPQGDGAGRSSRPRSRSPRRPARSTGPASSPCSSTSTRTRGASIPPRSTPRSTRAPAASPACSRAPRSAPRRPRRRARPGVRRAQRHGVPLLLDSAPGLRRRRRGRRAARRPGRHRDLLLPRDQAVRDRRGRRRGVPATPRSRRRSGASSTSASSPTRA